MFSSYEEKRRSVESYFTPQHRLDATIANHLSPCGRFSLTTSTYSTEPGAMKYSRGIITRISDASEIADVKRNAGTFWHNWLSHSNGSDYLLCGEDYQGYTIVNLTNSKTRNHFPAEALKGNGFCWANVIPSPDTLLLAVEGCIWAHPYDLVFYDFANPDVLPLKEIGRIKDYRQADGWLDNDTFTCTKDVQYRLSDGRSYDELSNAEQDALDAEPALAGYRTETLRFSRSHPRSDA